MEIFALTLFCAVLATCLALGQPLAFALVLGLVIFASYGKMRGHSFKSIFKMACSGVLAIKNITVVMLLIGALTALWRASGTIATIVSYSSSALFPNIYLPVSFVLCSLISVLTGTSFGTVATMGVICMSMGNTLGIDPVLSGGAIIAGSFFGDRCSPVSTSALLVAEITHTNIYDNVRGMLKTGLIPLLLALGVYTAIGFTLHTGSEILNVTEIFGRHYTLHWILILPAIAILVFTAFRIDVKITMAISIAISFALCIGMQGTSVFDTLKTTFLGFEAPAEISRMMSGGGVLGMLKMMLLIIVTFTYPGIFKGTGMLDRIHKNIEQLSTKVSPFTCTVLTAAATCALSCNQSLSIMLTNELSSKIIPDKNTRAIAIENSSVIIAPLIPWSVACLVPLSTINAPVGCLLFACYLYLIPAVEMVRNRKR